MTRSLTVSITGNTFCDCGSSPTAGRAIRVFLKSQEFAEPGAPRDIPGTLLSFSYNGTNSTVSFSYDDSESPEILEAHHILDFECYGYGCSGDGFSLERIWEICPGDELSTLG